MHSACLPWSGYMQLIRCESCQDVLPLPAACRASAVLGMDEDRICALQADHHNTARPADRASDAYIHLQEHIKRCLSKYYEVNAGLVAANLSAACLPFLHSCCMRDLHVSSAGAVEPTLSTYNVVSAWLFHMV